MRNFALLVAAAGIAAVVAVSCSGDAPKSVDAASGGSGFGATCTTASDTSTECMSGVCSNSFDMSPTPLCSEKCTIGDNSTCPAGGSGIMKCNGKGYCKP